MSAQPAPLDLHTLRRFIRAVRDLLTSEVRRQAIALLLFLLAFALSVNGLNVVNGYVGRDFMTAIAHREMAEFVRLAILYIGLFAAMTAVLLGRPLVGLNYRQSDREADFRADLIHVRENADLGMIVWFVKTW